MPAIVELLKYIYSLSQASKCFDEHISERLHNFGFRRRISDNQLFVKQVDKQFVCRLKHVDDLIIAAPKNSPHLAFVETWSRAST
jgi:hypothetical protein